VCAPRNRSLSGSGEDERGDVEEDVMVCVAEPVVGVAVPEPCWRVRVWGGGWRLDWFVGAEGRDDAMVVVLVEVYRFEGVGWYCVAWLWCGELWNAGPGGKMLGSLDQTSDATR
jgi:hypothetical protein